MNQDLRVGNALSKGFIRFRIRMASLKAKVFDRIYGIETEGEIRAQHELQIESEEYDYFPSYYGLLELIPSCLGLSEHDVVVDLGCGKGRVVFFFARYRLKKVIGVEVCPDLAAIALRNQQSFRGLQAGGVEILLQDASSFNPLEGTVFYMFNPFGEFSVSKVLENIRMSLKKNPRTVRVVYYVPVYRHLLDASSWLRFQGMVGNKECGIWVSCQQ